jgi:hypothetical protein
MMLRTRFMSVLALLLLAACAGGKATVATAPLTNSPVEADCRAEGRTAPEVKALQQQVNPGNWANERRVGYDIRVAELSAFRDCMRRNGMALPGGVESVRSPY